MSDRFVFSVAEFAVLAGDVEAAPEDVMREALASLTVRGLIEWDDTNETYRPADELAPLIEVVLWPRQSLMALLGNESVPPEPMARFSVDDSGHSALIVTTSTGGLEVTSPDDGLAEFLEVLRACLSTQRPVVLSVVAMVEPEGGTEDGLIAELVLVGREEGVFAAGPGDGDELSLSEITQVELETAVRELWSLQPLNIGGAAPSSDE